MPFSLTNRVINFPPSFFGVGESTSQQYLGTGTSSSTSFLGPYQEFGDYTTTGSIPGTTQIIAGGPGDFGAARLGWRAFVSFKAYGAATATATSTGAALPLATVGPLMTLEVATSTAFAPLYVVDYRYLPDAQSTAFNSTSTGTANVGGPSVFLFGLTPLNSGAQFARLQFYANGSAQAQASSTGIDAIIQAV